MHASRILSLSAVLVLLLSACRATLPEIIQNSEAGIIYLWKEAEAGRFRYNLNRNYPSLMASWPEYLRQHGRSIIHAHYTNTAWLHPKTRKLPRGWFAVDKEALLGRADGTSPYDYHFGRSRIIARETVKMLVEDFARRKKDADVAVSNQAVQEGAESSHG
ncbi:uncharacterized protein UMAG_02538 [Mycosarcoma maydis]|uniref:Uncharacterized protein n=1 Tax=Mycosarcoma maydis TaxID=5270 RepID=A0A0D1C6C3_MYCMD|nr:uncharacterized protein UMAG_02538 [Ustilago maydis 521]KIS69187.1 hypothetical protein UMAG_02538 [Ustilago maydis 521]|eukprot:XP_011388949.1 hypothetical protein UMAG_02538 [Ustilago maydis 521]